MRIGTRTLGIAVAVMVAGMPVPGAAQDGEGGKTIVDVAVEAGSFGTLVQAVEAAGLVETLSGGGPFTVFAPTDEAFAQLPEGTLESLLADREALRAVLTYHVVPGRVKAEDVVSAERLSPATVQGDRLSVRVEDGAVRVDEATVIQADVEASNGVIHVIDAVVLPASLAAGSP
jgi:uncharacterized surface protein with fasciclin (FAS1) repeats